MSALPRAVHQQCCAGDEILEPRNVGRRSLRALARYQVELGQMLAFLSCGDQSRPEVELIDDLEDCLLPFVWQDVRHEQSPYLEMSRGAQFFRDQGIGGFLDPVVKKPVGIFRAEEDRKSTRLNSSH